MTAGWHVRALQAALLPCPLVLVLAGCTTAVKRPPAPAAGGALAAVDAPTAAALQAQVEGLGEQLSREQQDNALLQEQLKQRGQEVEQLHGEVEGLRARETDLRGDLERARAGQASDAATAGVGAAEAEPNSSGDNAPAFAAAATASRDDRNPADTVGPGVLVTTLRAALSEEQQRRQAAETQLARLQAETSTLPYDNGGPLAADFAAAKQEIVELRRVLDDERATRTRLADDLKALQLRTASISSPGQTDAGDDAGLRARVERLQAERQEAVDGLSRSLAASQQRTAELEAELATARAAAPSPAGGGENGVTGEQEMASVRAENSALRAQLDEEHRRTQELAGKLKLAARVTDLIFKMQAQQAAPPAR